MNKLIKKEFTFSGQPISYYFLVFSVMTFLPGYPILCGSFFMCLGIFFSFQAAREGNDALFTALLPVRKADAVKARFIWVCALQMISFVLNAVFTVIRMALLSGAQVYIQNAMMNANIYYLGFVLLIFTVFNGVFVRGFWKDAISLGKPFLISSILTFLIITVAEALHHIPGLEFFNASQVTLAQCAFLIVCAAVYAATTLLSCQASQKSFESVQL